MTTDVKAKQRTDRQWVEGILVSAQERDWFGTITIEVKRGMIHLVQCAQTLKPPSASSSD